jgi:hypothetical protein
VGPAGPAGPQGPAGATVNYRAGSVVIGNGQSSATVLWTTALPSASFRVSVNPSVSSGNIGWSSQSGVYFNISSKSTTGFTITARKPDDGSAVTMDTSGGVTLDWIAISDNNP